eukprot:4383099-Amphidinium_carterae.1
MWFRALGLWGGCRDLTCTQLHEHQRNNRRGVLQEVKVDEIMHKGIDYFKWIAGFGSGAVGENFG